MAERADIPLKSNLQLLALEEAIPAGGQGKPARNWGRVVRRLRLTACGAVIFCSYLWGTGLRAQVQVRSEEYRLKLVFLYNFAKFVEWPEDAFPTPQAPLKLCVVGQNPFDHELQQQLAERSINGHPYVTQTVRASDDLSGCHIIFLPAANDSSLSAILKREGGSKAITVGESARFARRGGTVNFVLEGPRLRFEVNIDATQRSRSRISSRLLVLAKIVKEQQP